MQQTRTEKIAIFTALWALLCALPSVVHAADPAPAAAAPEAPPAPRAHDGGKESKERNFYEVLDDVLSDFEYDLKNGNVSGMKNVSLRNIAMSENIPPSFRSHLDLLVTERILKITKTKVVQCLPCRSKKTSVTGDQVIISSPDTSPTEMSRIAKASGIDHFIDMAFTYQPSGIVLSMTTTDPETGTVVWSRSYNSENSRASAFRRGVDYSQLDDARKQTEYTPTIQYRAIVYYLFEPNATTSMTGVLGLGFRTMERYDNRKKEVGFELDYLRDSSTLVGSTAASTTTVNLYSGINLTLLFLHGWNMIGEEENFNKMRGNATVGIGGTYSSGFLGPLIRAQYEWRLGKHYSVSAVGGYRPSSTAFLNNTSAGTVSGAEFGIGVNMLF